MTLNDTDLFNLLDTSGISYVTHSHPPVFTVEEAQKYCGDLPGAHSKNLFLKDKKKQLWLVVTLDQRKVDIKELQKMIGSARLSFGKSDLLQEVLGVIPGSVSPFALINDRDCSVNVILDAGMMQAKLINFHPLRNDMTTSITPDDLRRFVKLTGQTLKEYDFIANKDL